MRIADILHGLGSPVSYYPPFRRICGSVGACILLQQLIYWGDKGEREDGFIYKSQWELELETGLSYDEQVGARKKLVEQGLLHEKRIGVPAKMHFRVNVDRLDELWSNQDESWPDYVKAKRQTELERIAKTRVKDEKTQENQQYTEKQCTSTPKRGVQVHQKSVYKNTDNQRTITETTTETIKDNSSRPPTKPPAAASSPSARPPKKQVLNNSEIEAAIQALPAEHQADAKQVCKEEEAADQIKLDALNLFVRQLAAGKADNCGFLREAIKGDWGAKGRIKEKQEAERQVEAQKAAAAAAAWADSLPPADLGFWIQAARCQGYRMPPIVAAHHTFLRHLEAA